jgi:hypothetical protein
MCATNIIVQYIEGPEGVKWDWDLLIFGWENGILCTGIHQQKNNRKWE